MRKKNGSGKNMLVKKVNVDDIDTIFEVRCFWVQPSSWCKNATKTMSVRGKNVLENIKHEC